MGFKILCREWRHRQPDGNLSPYVVWTGSGRHLESFKKYEEALDIVATIVPAESARDAVIVEEENVKTVLDSLNKTTPLALPSPPEKVWPCPGCGGKWGHLLDCAEARKQLSSNWQSKRVAALSGRVVASVVVKYEELRIVFTDGVVLSYARRQIDFSTRECVLEVLTPEEDEHQQNMRKPWPRSQT